MKRILIIRQGSIPFDARVVRDIGDLVREGFEVDVLSQRVTGYPNLERQPSVTIYRLPLPRGWGGILAYLLEYAAFFLMAASLATMLHVKRRYSLIQVHSMPDPLVFAALIPKILGVPVLLDLHEPMPEFFASKFGLPANHFWVRLMGRVEQLSISFANHVLTCTNQMREAFIQRGAPPNKISVVLLSTDPDTFNPLRFPPRPRSADRFDLICHGTIEERYGIDAVIRAVAELRDEMPELRLRIYGVGSYLPVLRALAQDLTLDGRILFSEGFRPLSELLQAIADADVGVVAMKRDAFRDLTHCHKMFDYIAMQRPVIVSRTAAVEAYFDENCFELFESDNVPDLVRAIRDVRADTARCQRMVKHTNEVMRPYERAIQRGVYLEAVKTTLASNGARPGTMYDVSDC